MLQMTFLRSGKNPSGSKQPKSPLAYESRIMYEKSLAVTAGFKPISDPQQILVGTETPLCPQYGVPIPKLP